MAVNRDKPDKWKADIAQSVDMYNDREEAAQMIQLRQSYGEDAQCILFLCGYFDSGYLGCEAAEGIDGIWEHRIEDLGAFGL